MTASPASTSRRATGNDRPWIIAAGILTALTVVTIVVLVVMTVRATERLNFRSETQALLLAGQELYWQGKYPEAETALLDALHNADDPRAADFSSPAHALLADLYESRGDFEASWKQHEAYLKLREDGDSLSSQYQFGWLAFLQGKDAEAAVIYEPLMKAQQNVWASGDRSQPYQVEVIALVLAKTGQVDAGLAWLAAASAQYDRVAQTTVLQQSGARELLRLVQAELLNRAGRSEEAAALIEGVRQGELIETNVPLQAFLAAVEGQDDAARTLLDQLEPFQQQRFEVLDDQARGMARELALEQRRIIERLLD